MGKKCTGPPCVRVFGYCDMKEGARDCGGRGLMRFWELLASNIDSTRQQGTARIVLRDW